MKFDKKPIEDFQHEYNLLVSALFEHEMDNICNGYSRPNDSSTHGLGILVEKRQGNLQMMKRKRWFTSR